MSTAELRGRALLRPWRIGVLVDTSSATQVRDAIAKLSNVWGGYYMPILDINETETEIGRQGRKFDVDSLHAEAEAPAVEEFLRRSGWGWVGRGPHGPFAEEDGLRQGILPLRALASALDNVVIPIWGADDPLDLFYSTLWGAPLDGQSDSAGGSQGVAMGIGALVAAQLASGVKVGRVEGTRLHVTAARRYAFDSPSGIFVARVDSPQDLVAFWNLRIYGTQVMCLPHDGDEQLLRYLTREDMPGVTLTSGGENPSSRRGLDVWGLDRAARATAAAIDDLAQRCGLEVTGMDRKDPIPYVFQGVRTQFTRSVRADFVLSAHSVDVDLPDLPLTDEPNAIRRGVVAAVVSAHTVAGQDPRFTAAIPSFRRYSTLLRQVGLSEGVDQIRVSEDGVTFGIQADTDQLALPFAYNLDVFRVLFDDETATTSQSDVGKFQTRAAQMLGGPLSGFLIQPGVRAALLDAAQKSIGITYQQMVQSVRDNRGEWPDAIRAHNTTDLEYARQQVNALLHAGIFVPLLDVHCSHCRVNSQVTPRDLDTTMRCEFCGEEFNLALSLALRKGQWRYRLASHLSAERVKALLPPLAVMSTLQQLHHVQSPPMSHVLGLEVKFKGGKRVEVDVAAYLPDHQGEVAILGEVKNSNQIDENDIRNLEFLQHKLFDKDVPCIVLVGTLKEALAPAEAKILRELVERSAVATLGNSQLVPMMPLVLTGPDVSRTWFSEVHPWRWNGPGRSTPGVFGTAISSCERNLGLKSYDLARDGDRWAITCQWDEVPDPSVS